jgi:hypothetical protein
VAQFRRKVRTMASRDRDTANRDALYGPQVWFDVVMRGLPLQNLVLSDLGGIATP